MCEGRKVCTPSHGVARIFRGWFQDMWSEACRAGFLGHVVGCPLHPSGGPSGTARGSSRLCPWTLRCGNGAHCAQGDYHMPSTCHGSCFPSLALHPCVGVCKLEMLAKVAGVFPYTFFSSACQMDTGSAPELQSADLEVCGLHSSTCGMLGSCV